LLFNWRNIFYDVPEENRMEKGKPSDLLNNVIRVFGLHTDDYFFIKDKNFAYQMASESFKRLCGLDSTASIVGRDDYPPVPQRDGGQVPSG
jgi:hypothetical protein